MASYDPYLTMRFQQPRDSVDNQRVFKARVRFMAMLCVAASVAVVVTGDWRELPVIILFATVLGGYVRWMYGAPKRPPGSH